MEEKKVTLALSFTFRVLPPGLIMLISLVSFDTSFPFLRTRNSVHESTQGSIAVTLTLVGFSAHQNDVFIRKYRSVRRVHQWRGGSHV